MGINVIDANQKAGALEDNARQLVNAKKNLETYREMLSVSWVGTETGFMVKGINQSISELDSAIAELNQLAADIRQTAEAIHQEELRQERIANAQVAYNAKQTEVQNHVRLLDEAKKRLSDPKKYGLSEKKIAELQKGVKTLNKEIHRLQGELSACQVNLENAQRS